MKSTIIKNTITKALILFVALITATSLLASENTETEEMFCQGAKSFTLSDSGDEQIVRIVGKFEFKNKAFPYNKKVEIGKIESQTFYLELDTDSMMTLSAEDKNGQTSSIEDSLSVYYEHKSDKDNSETTVACVMESFSFEDLF